MTESGRVVGRCERVSWKYALVTFFSESRAGVRACRSRVSAKLVESRKVGRAGRKGSGTSLATTIWCNSRLTRPLRPRPSTMTVDTQLFQLVASSALQGLLDRIVGPKTLILNPSLAGPLGLVTEVGLLKVTLLYTR